MTRLALAFALALVSIGCGGLSDLDVNPDWVVEGPARAAEAIELAKARLGPAAWLPVVWYGGAALESCAMTSGGIFADQDFVTPIGCTDGITGDNASLVGWDGTRSAAETSLFHELAHQRYGDSDHANAAIWGERGQGNYVPGTVVGDGNLELLARGM